MEAFAKLTPEEGKILKSFDKDLEAIKKAASLHDRQLRRDVQEELRKTASDISNVPKAIVAATKLGECLSCDGHAENEANAITSALEGIRQSITKGPLSKFLKPIFRRATGVAKKRAADLEEKEAREAKQLRFPYTRSAAVLHLQNCVKNLDRLGNDPAPSLPFGGLAHWLEKRHIEA